MVCGKWKRCAGNVKRCAGNVKRLREMEKVCGKCKKVCRKCRYVCGKWKKVCGKCKKVAGNVKRCAGNVKRCAENVNMCTGNVERCAGNGKGSPDWSRLSCDITYFWTHLVSFHLSPPGDGKEMKRSCLSISFMSCRPEQFILQPFPMSVTNWALILHTGRMEIIRSRSEFKFSDGSCAALFDHR